MEPRKTYEAKRVLANLYHDAAMQESERKYKEALSALQRAHLEDTSALNSLYETIAQTDKETLERETVEAGMP